MATLLVKNADLLLTMDKKQMRIPEGGIYVRDNVIEKVGLTSELPDKADRMIDANGMVVMPGLINTHHHLYQTLTRALPGAQDAELFDWLVRLYPVWGELTDEANYVSSIIGFSELILTGCTTTADHLYLYPNDVRLDTSIRAAQEIGIRFHPTRGSMSLGHSKGGLPPDHVVQDEETIIKDSRRLIETYHDPNPYSMLRISLAPCSPFSVTRDEMIEAAELARSYDKVMLHTHVAETKDEERFCIEKFGVRPVKYMQQLGWVGPDVWWAHCIYLNDDEIKLMAETGTGVAHCPASNMRLGSGIANIRQMLDEGVKVGLAVDGSASNDRSSMLEEARLALLLQRVDKGAKAISVMEVLEIATLGSASVLGRDDLGMIAPGKAADFIGFKTNRLEVAGGAVHDPVAALLLCPPYSVDLSIINGCQVVRDGKLLGVDLERMIARHNELAAEMAARHPYSEKQ
jgi:cytosine/adenosine deaminase-related metal-dependent hydrolase